jgi:two-component system, sensor histidine kinase
LEKRSLIDHEKSIGRSSDPLIGTSGWSLFTPSQRFADKSLETAFLNDYCKRFLTSRRTAIGLALIIWALFAVLDYRNYVNHPCNGTGKCFGDHEVLTEVLKLRAYGGFLLALSVLISRTKFFQSEIKATWILGIGVTGCYWLLLQMYEEVNFPYDLLYYYTGLLLVLIFLFGFLRLRSYAVIIIAIPCLMNTTYSVLHSVVEYKSEIGYGGAISILTYIMVFSGVGLAITIELERTARSTFFREISLQLSNQDASEKNIELENLKSKVDLRNKDLQEINASLKQAINESENKTAALIELKEDLRLHAERKNQDKSYFLAAATHDLRQPMYALGNYLEAAKMALIRKDTDQASEWLTQAHRASGALGASFEAVLDISQLEAGAVKISYSNFLLNKLTDEIYKSMHPLAVANNVELKLFSNKAKSAIITSDRSQLGRVISNLVMNAIKYSDPKKIRSVVTIGLIYLGNRIRIDVVDNGIGIPKEHWEEIFKPFVQLGNSNRDREKGLGLGLSTVNLVIGQLEQHRIWMNSNVGVGTKFSLDVPISEATFYSENTSALDSTEISDLRGIYVMLIEDDIDVQKSTQAILNEHGLICESASTYEAARILMLGREIDPDIVITDYHLPNEKTAVDIVHLVRQMMGQNIPVIIISGQIHQADSSKELDGLLKFKKPLQATILLNAIRQSIAP